MRLPGLINTVVAERKVAGYLLALNHPAGRHQARLLAHGFQAATWEALAAALERHAAPHEVARVEDPPFGKR